MNANTSFASRPKAEQHYIIQSTLERALADEPLASIAESFGIPRTTLNYNLLLHAYDEWRDTQAARATTDLQDAEIEVRTAADGLSLARGRESLRAAQWRLEKLLRRLYGDDKTAIQINAEGQVSVQIVSFAVDAVAAIDAVQQVQCNTDSRIIEGEKVE